MPHQCVHCGKIYPTGSKEILEGCSCGSRFFYYIKDEEYQKLKEKIPLLTKEEKKQIERDIREMSGIKKEDAPIVLDLESIRAISPGKFEIDIVNLFNKHRPIIYKVEEGKYIIDLASTFEKNKKN